MNPDATGFQTGRLNKLNRRGPSTDTPESVVFHVSSLEAPNECPRTGSSIGAPTLGTGFGSGQPYGLISIANAA